MCGKVPTEASRGMGVPGAGLSGVCEVPDGGAGTQAQLSTLNEPQALFVTAKPSPAPERMQFQSTNLTNDLDPEVIKPPKA